MCHRNIAARQCLAWYLQCVSKQEVTVKSLLLHDCINNQELTNATYKPHKIIQMSFSSFMMIVIAGSAMLDVLP